MTKIQTVPGPLPDIFPNGSEEKRSNSAQSYVYQYGIKNIGIYHSSYEQTGVFVSKPIEVEGNIIEVSLSAGETHPLFDEMSGMATSRMTSIEYYISLEENPSLNDWIPILPEEQDRVICEKLFFKGSTAKLRFHANINDIEQTAVYKNGLLLEEKDWYFTEQGASIQLVGKKEDNAIYTIDYVPDFALHNPHNIEVGKTHSKRIRTVEQFPNGTDSNNTIKLSRYPFVDYSYINQLESYDPNEDTYRPLDVFIKGEIAAGNGKTQKEFAPIYYTNESEFVTKNKTDYKESKDVSLRPYSIVPEEAYKIFEYKQYKNKLIFTESFNKANMYYNEATNHGNATVEVHYDYLVANFRLKIILRKNSGDELVATPIVDYYQLKFKVMK